MSTSIFTLMKDQTGTITTLGQLVGIVRQLLAFKTVHKSYFYSFLIMVFTHMPAPLVMYKQVILIDST
ncbi:hypothetical protein [Bartonella sp. AD13SXNS]|uniref:hypothetical protein n=1 Tax=Bartonella sp. AD13SXNS TaxID=3243462 RepID=UPI0035CF1EAD